MILQLSHANENEDGVGYTVKHVLIRASSLLRAHIFVTRFGYCISPEYYDDTDEFEEPPQQYIDDMLQNYTLERFEGTNEECSQGEHFWHALKIAPNKGAMIQLNGQLLFKVTIRFHTPCLHQYSIDLSGYNLYKNESNSDIYQFQAEDSMHILHYLRKNSDRFNLTDFFTTFPDSCDWQMIEKIMEERWKCIESNHVHGEFIGLSSEQLQSPLPLIDANM